jgi:hypothetical protein
LESFVEEMSDSQTNRPSPVRKAIKVVLWLAGIILGLFFLMVFTNLVFGPVFYQMAVVLPFGWVGFCQRVLTEMTVNWDLLGMALLCLAVGGVVLHQFLRWLAGYVGKARGSTFVWPVRWTGCGLILMGFFFVIGTTVSGVKQQVEWIRQSDAPRTVLRSPSLASAMKLLAMDMSFEIEEGAANYKVLQNKFRSYDGASIYPAYRPAIKHLHGLAIYEEGKCVGFILFPRDGALLAKHGGQYVTTNSMEWVTPEKLKDVLVKHRANLRSL